jgi:hypothetical protein
MMGDDPLVKSRILLSTLAGMLLTSFGTKAALAPVQQAYLKASSAQNQLFGESLAVSHETIVIGARAESSNAKGVNSIGTNGTAFGSGAAYIFDRKGANWTQQAYLKASNADGIGPPGGGLYSGDLFGISVAIDGDIVVVGAIGEQSSAIGVNGNPNDNSATNSGAAYVFVRSATNWTQQAYLKASNAEQLDFFGSSVALSGETAVVGAPRESSNARGVNGNESDNSSPVSGAVYVFVRDGTNWTQQAYLKASNADSNDWFGSSVALSGDTLVVGAYQEDSGARDVNGDPDDNSAANLGAAYVFVRNGSNWVQQAYLKPANGAIGDNFGTSVAVSGDIIVVGAPFQDISDAGAAYIFVRSGTNWIQEAYLKASNGEGRDLFGRSVGISVNTVAVGGSAEDSGAAGVNGDQNDNSLQGAGAAYVFVRNGTNWTQEAYLKASNPGGNDRFAYSVALSVDTIVAGAFFEDSDATGVDGDQNNDRLTDAGAAYVFNLKPPVFLNAERLGNGMVRLFWPLSAGDFVIDQTFNLTLPPATNSWNAILPPYQTNGQDISITVAPSGNEFYRLRKP